MMNMTENSMDITSIAGCSIGMLVFLAVLMAVIYFVVKTVMSSLTVQKNDASVSMNSTPSKKP